MILFFKINRNYSLYSILKLFSLVSSAVLIKFSINIYHFKIGKKTKHDNTICHTNDRYYLKIIILTKKMHNLSIANIILELDHEKNFIIHSCDPVGKIL